MHILFVDGGYPYKTTGGGAGTYIKNISGPLLAMGNQVSVLSSFLEDASEFYIEDGVKVYRPGAGFTNFHWYVSKIIGLSVLTNLVRYLEKGFKAYRIIERINSADPIDLIEFSEGGDFWHSIFHKIPYIAHLHGSSYTIHSIMHLKVPLSIWLQRKAELFFIKRADHILVPSLAILKKVMAEASYKLPNASVIPLPIVPLDATASFAKPQDDKVRVVFAGRNDPVKGGDVLYKAIEQLDGSQTQLEFHFFGWIPTGKPKKMNILFHPFSERKVLLEFMVNCDIVVVPSYWETSPNIVYEAMALGKPVVASNVGGIPELVDENTGILFPAGDAIALAIAIRDLALNQDRRISMGQAGLDKIRTIGNLDENIQRRLDIYKKVAKTP